MNEYWRLDITRRGRNRKQKLKEEVIKIGRDCKNIKLYDVWRICFGKNSLLKK